MIKKRLLIDMDGTLARFHDRTNYLECMYEKDFFRELDPFDNMIAGIKQFIKDQPDVEVYIVSAKVISPYCEEEKNAWVDRYLPEIDTAHRIYTDIGRSKAEYLPGGVTKNDYLLDDYNKGLNLFLYDGGSAIKCHNNINHRGLGAYGGEAGRMWFGPVIHTDDTPAMISAELAQHMDLEYDLHKVVSAYPDMAFAPANDRASIKHFKKQLVETKPGEYAVYERFDHYPFNTGTFVNPLNAVRVLAGREEFAEVKLKTSTGIEFKATKDHLRAVCMNVYGNPDYQRFYRADRTQLADDTFFVRENATRAIVGLLNFLNHNGEVSSSKVYYDAFKLQDTLHRWEQLGHSVSAEWLVKVRSEDLQQDIPKKPSIDEIISKANDIRKESHTHEAKQPTHER